MLFNIFLNSTIVFLLSVTAFAENRKVLVYPTTRSVSFKGDPNSGSGCRLALQNSMPAELLEERDGLLHIRFEKPVNGCFLDQLTGRNLQEGWIPKNEITYAADDNEELQPTSSPAPTPDPTEEPCPEENNITDKNLGDIGDLVTSIREENSGLKSEADVETYLACYPQSPQGHQNYLRYKPMIEKVTEVFHANLGLGDISINKNLFSCLLRRESGFDPKAESGTGAVGLGQHTSINIEHINNRLQTKNSWESRLWERFFSEVSQTAEGQKLLNECPATANGKKPTFANKNDARCPLNSMAASAIYNLQVQQALRRTSSLKHVDWKNPLRAEEIAWEDEQSYLLAIGASYNLGDGAASRAVDDLELDGWITSIRNRSPNPWKRAEVAAHIEALRNCLQKDNWNPMHPGDRPQCQLPTAPKTVPLPQPRPADL